MATFVLVHGAWHGGWCWSRVAGRLRDAGHDVFTPTLTGLGERAHLATPETDLATHVGDIVAVFEAEEIDDVILCGHSYDGMVITGAADRLSDRLRAMVYLDAFIPEDGQSLFDLRGAEHVATYREQAAKTGDGWRIPPLTPEYFGVMDAEDAEWVRRRCVDQPIDTMAQPVSLTGAGASVPRKVYILAEKHPNSGFGPFAERTRNDPEWEFHGLPSGHDVMVDMPAELSAILLQTAT